MDKKEIKITIPEGYEIDKENSTFEKIVFKKVTPTRWRNRYVPINGFYIDTCSEINSCSGWNASPDDYNLFATEKQAKSAIAMARISQIMANDARFGGIVTDEEWEDNTTKKYVIYRAHNMAISDYFSTRYHFLSFHTKNQRDLFLEENMDLVKDYYMIE